MTRCWRHLAVISLASWFSNIMMVGAASLPPSMPPASTTTQSKGPKKFLYRSMDSGEADPIFEYYYGDQSSHVGDPPFADTGKNKPPFIYANDYPYHRVVEFYSPMCPHCVHFAPHYVEFARHFTKLTQLSAGNATNSVNTTSQEMLAKGNHYTGMKVEFHAVSCLVYREICSTQKINSYPSLLVFKKGTSKGTRLKFTELHPMSLIKTLGVSTVDDYWEEKEEELAERSQGADMSTRTKELSALPAFLMRSPQEIFSDAYLSFHTAMKTSIFMEEGGGAAIPKARQYVLQNWLDLLQKVLPPWRIHDLLGALLGGQAAGVKNTAFVANIETEEKWNAILDQYPPRQTEFSRACRQHESPYTCGLWTLFHIVTVGVVEFNSDIANREHDRFHVFNNQVVAKMIKEYVEHFLLCDACTTHFIEEYDACMYDRCTRLSDKHAGNLDAWKELPLWLLETHNGVNVRLQQERFEDLYQKNQSLPARPTEEQEQSVMWPSVQECAACWLEHNGTESLKKYNHFMMSKYLRLVYWYVSLLLTYCGP